MEKFLHSVASYLYGKHHGHLEQLTVVFPNRRAGLFFQKYLSTLTEKPIFSPSIITISEMVSGFSPLKVDDNSSLVVQLWETFMKITSIEEPLDDFFYWGEMLLSDFNDIDKYLVDAKQLFKNIMSLKEIDSGFEYLSKEQILFLSTFWQHILQVKNSGEKDSFIKNWANLFPVYNEFNKSLQTKGLAYEGMIYRQMAEMVKAGTSHWEGKNIAFVGFNALNNCEKALFDHVKINCKADFFWDFDQFYMQKNDHEAAFFMHSNLKRYPAPVDFSFSDNNFEKLANIDLVSIPGFSGQAIYASNWLAENNQFINSLFDNTAIVLCDESLLPSVLSSLPDTIADINITMGFPLKNSVVFALLKGLIDLDRNGRKGNNNETLYYYRNVLALLNNPLIKPFVADFIESLNLRIKQNNLIYITKSEVVSDELLASVFEVPDDAPSVKEYLHAIIKKLFARVPDDDPFVKEALYQLYLLVNRQHSTLFVNKSFSDRLVSKKLFYQLLLRSAEKMSIPFEGEPLSGMQLMGFLETRCLDFENLILLSFNDEKLPGVQHQHSFIPNSLRKGFDLPVIEHRNAMYAYYFYRLLQRAKRVTLVFDSRTEALSRGEVCRYAKQLKYEAADLTLVEKQGVFNFETVENNPIIVEKDRGLLEKLEKIIAEKRLSPTMLNSYIECGLKFYFNYVESIRESDDVSEEIDQLVFGKVAHSAMEELYKPFLGKTIEASFIKSMLDNHLLIDKVLFDALEKEFFKGGSFNKNGKNLLVIDIIRKYIRRMLKYDMCIAPLEIISLETEYTTNIDLKINDKLFRVTVGGIIDRLDRVGGRIRVVDYKSGRSLQKVQSVESLFIPHTNRNKAAFQTMVYAHCVNQVMLPNEPVLPAVYGASFVFSDFFDPYFKMGNEELDYKSNSLEFVDQLKQTISSILDPSLPFSQVRDVKPCSYCAYNSICNRK
jgi:hypothetical protein